MFRLYGSLRSRRFLSWAFIIFFCALSGYARPLHADALSDFYKGKSVRLIISSTAGGGYDLIGRLVARTLGEHLPGHPTIVPQDMPGGGGITAANYLYSVAPKDGTVIAVIQNDTVFEPFYENKDALFDPTKFNWLGTPFTEVSNYLIWHDSKIKTLNDAQTEDFVVGAPGAISTPAFYGRLFNKLFGLKAQIITAYPGQNEIFQAMESREVDGVPSSFWPGLKTVRPTWISDGTVRSLFQYGDQPNAELKGVPFALDLLSDPTDKAVLSAATAPFALGRPFAAPPDIPVERLEALREGMIATFKDPQFLADCAQQKLDCTGNKTGDQLKSAIEKGYAAPDVVKQRLMAIQE